MAQNAPTVWPVIVNLSLSNSDFVKILAENHLKVRISSSTVTDSIILPLSGVAFMVLPLHTATLETGSDGSTQLQQGLVIQLEKFVNTHAHCYILALAPLHGPRELQINSQIQMRLQMIPIHNINEGVKAIMSIGKLLCKPTSDLMYKRLNKIVKERTSDDIVTPILQQLGLSDHQIQVIQDGLGSLSRLATAEEEDLLDCSLDKDTVSKILKFFNGSK